MPKSPRLDDTVELLRTEQLRARSKIQAGALVMHVARIANGEDKDNPPRQQARIAAAKLLLAKALPDLSAVDVKSEHTGKVTITIVKEA